MTKEVKNTVPWTYVINDFNGEEIIGLFYDRTTKNKSARIEDRKSHKKGNKLYVKWKGYNNSFNSWTDKKDLIE